MNLVGFCVSFVAVPRSADESRGAIIVHLELLRWVLDLHVLPLDLKLFRERSCALFAALALLAERPRTLPLRFPACLWWAVVASPSLAAAALISDLALRSFDLKARRRDSRELNFEALILCLPDGDALELLACLDLRLEALLDRAVDNDSERDA